MEGASIDLLKMSDTELSWAQKSMFIDAIALKESNYDKQRRDRKVEIGTAGQIVKKALNVEFYIYIDEIRINGMRGNNFRRDRNGGHIDMEYPTGIQNVLLVFTYNSREGLARHNPSSTALVIKGNMGSL